MFVGDCQRCSYVGHDDDWRLVMRLSKVQKAIKTIDKILNKDIELLSSRSWPSQNLTVAVDRTFNYKRENNVDVYIEDKTHYEVYIQHYGVCLNRPSDLHLQLSGFDVHWAGGVGKLKATQLQKLFNCIEHIRWEAGASLLQHYQQRQGNTTDVTPEVL